MSYRRRLVLLAAFAVALAVALASVVTYVSVRAQLRDSVDDGLRALAARVATQPLPTTGDQPRRLNLDEQQRRRSFLLLLPSSPLGEQAGYAQVVSSAGKILLFAHTKRGAGVGIDLASICVDEKDLIGSYSSSAAIQDEAAAIVFNGYAEGYDLTRLVSHRFPLDRAVEAIELASHPQAHSMKIMIEPAVV